MEKGIKPRGGKRAALKGVYEARLGRTSQGFLGTVFRDGRVLSTAYKRPQTMKGGHEWWKYVYDEYYDCVICPEYQVLSYRTTNRNGYREYGSDPKICAQCPTRHLCTHSENCVKTVLLPSLTGRFFDRLTGSFIQ